MTTRTAHLRRLATALAVGSALLAATAAAASPAVQVDGRKATARAGGARFAFSAPTHSPRVEAPWKMLATARRGGRGLNGRVEVEAMFHGAVVGHIDSGRLRGGTYRKTIRWPKRAAGYPLTVRATLKAAGHATQFLYPVTVRL